MTSTTIPFQVSQNIERLDNLDADIRFMAFSDLSALLSNPANRSVFASDSQLVHSILVSTVKKLDDDVADVQAQAVKCLDPLMGVVQDNHVGEFLKLLSQRFADPKDNSSITYMALRSVICKTPANASIAKVFNKQLLPLLESIKVWNIDTLDALTDYLKRFGSTIDHDGIARIEVHLTNIISSGRGIVRKRAVAALGYLVKYIDAARWDNLIDYISDTLNANTNPGSLQAVVLLAGTLAKSEPARFKHALPRVFVQVFDCLKLDEISEDEDEGLLETREAVLSTLEAFITLGSPVEPYVESIISAVTAFISYDPNYNADDEDVDMGDGSDDDFGFSEDEAFSEDDDQSWKLRRHAARLAGIIAQNIGAALPLLTVRLLDLFVKRVGSEREDSVKADVLSTLKEFCVASRSDGVYYTSKLYKRRSSDASMNHDDDPRSRISSVSDKLLKLAEKDCSKPSTAPSILHAYISVIQGLVVALEGVDAALLPSISNILQSLSLSRNPMMIDILGTILVLFKYQSLDELPTQPLLNLVVQGVNDSFYKVSIEGLAAVAEIFELYKTEQPAFDESIVQEIESSVLAKATSTSQDVETREKAVTALAKVLSLCPVISPQNLNRGFGVIVELIGNESLRVPAISASEALATSGKQLDAGLVEQTVDLLCRYLRLSSKPLRLASLSALHAFTSRGAGSEQVSEHVIAHAQNSLATEYDAQIVGLTSLILSDLVAHTTARAAEFAVRAVATVDATQPEHQILQLVTSLAKALSLAEKDAFYQQLVDLPNSPLLHKSIASVMANGKEQEFDLYASSVQSGQGDVKRSLAVLGYLGMYSSIDIDLSILIAQFSSVDDSIRLGAAQAVGHNVTNHIEHLDVLIQGLSSEKATLYLTSMREVVVAGKIPVGSIEEIWNSLFLIRTTDESAMAKIAECVGRLSVLSPDHYLPQLQLHLRSTDWSVRAIALSAVKYSFSQSQDYDNLLRPIVTDFLGLVEDSDLKIRQVVMSTLVAAIHNKPHLLIPHLSTLLSILYKETVINQDLIKTVRVGPFKHKEDSGLELRKTAYEAIYTLVTTLSTYVRLDELFQRVLSGLKDDHDIKVLCCVIVGRIAQIDFAVIANSAPLEGNQGGIENVIGLFSGMMSVTVKEEAIKQEHEKLSEVKRNVERTTQIIDEVVNGPKGASSLNDLERGSWQRFVTATRGKESK